MNKNTVKSEIRNNVYRGIAYDVPSSVQLEAFDKLIDNLDSGVDSDIEKGIFHPNEFVVKDTAYVEGNDAFYPLSVEPNTTYIFDASDYSWVGVSVDGEMNGHTGSDKVIEFTTGATTTEVVAQFYPGYIPETVNTPDLSNIKFYKKDGINIKNKQDKLVAGSGISISGNVISVSNTKLLTVSPDFVSGGLILESGGVYENEYRITTDYIQVSSGDKLNLSAVGSDWEVSGCIYNSSKTLVSTFPDTSWTDLGEYTVPSSGFVRLTFRQGGYQGTSLTTDDSSKITITRLTSSSSSSSSSGSSSSGLISTEIAEILLTASSANPIEIVLMGDSITEGYSATGMESAGSSHPVPTWANYDSWAGLFNSYITSNFPNVTVTNRGYSGQVSAYGATNVSTWVTNSKQIVLVMYGTNNRTSQANMDSLAGDYTTILNRCEAVGAKMVPMCCIPTTTFNQNISGKYVGTMEQVHEILSNWASEKGYELLDLYSMMMTYIDNDLDNLESMGLIYVGSNDNNLHIHPSDAGHAVMYNFIINRLGISTLGGGGGGNGKYRHRVSMYCLSGGTTYVVTTFYNNRSTPYNAATTTTTDEIETFKADVLAAGYTTALQKGVLMCSGIIQGEPVYGMYMGTSSSGLSAVEDKLNFINGTAFNINLPLETGGTSSASTSLRLWDTVEVAGGGGGGTTSSGSSSSGSTVDMSGFTNLTKTAIPCTSGFSNFSTASVYWKTPDNIVHLTAAITVSTNCPAGTTVFNMPAGYRPSETVVLPCTIAYESNADPIAGGVNVNTNGTCVYYGTAIGSGRHIIINAVYSL